jgi:L-arabinose isomerase
VVEDRVHGFKLVAAHGECVPGEMLRIGNTNSHYRFPIGAKGFVNAWNAQGPAHHCTIGLGHMSPTLTKLARLLEIPLVQVC